MASLSEVNQQVAKCQLCALAGTRNLAVPGEGDENALIVFIGEAPGYYEDRQGRPFVGAAGQFLDQLLASINLERSRVYITNIIKCRPPNNRDPLPGEVQACRGWLEQQLALIKPRVIVTLGRHSMARFMPDKTIGRVHGTVISQNGVVYCPMYHPAAALHQQSLRATIEADFLKLPAILQELDKPAEPLAAAEVEPTQLNLF